VPGSPAGGGVGGSTGARTVAAPIGPLPRYIVRTAPGELDKLLTDLRNRSIDVTSTITLISAAVVQASATQAADLGSDPLVSEVTADAPVRLESDSYDPSSDPSSIQNIAAEVGATSVWNAGDTGQGVDVALIDSGVTPVPGLGDPGQVVNGPDLSFDSQSDGTRYLDAFGHGTFMAGLIAAHDPADGSVTGYQGIAPGARIINVKVADAEGQSDVTQVIAGIDWVVQHAHDPGMNIRVLNLSFGTDSTQPYTLDPLAYAAEAAWHAGIVVVVSAGNSGGQALTDPADDPYVIAVGAADPNGTIRIGNDLLAPFSNTGTRGRRPDVVAPGTHVEGLRVPGSFIDDAFGSTGELGDRYFRGSGTSEAAAITSGVVALMLGNRPNLTPDQVKRLLTNTATDLSLAGPGQGDGLVNAYRATFNGWAGPAISQRFRQSSGTGTIEGARGSYHVTFAGQTLTGEQDIFGNPVDTTALAAAEAAGSTWSGGTWNGTSWAGDAWSGLSWAPAAWTSPDWSGASWAGDSWAGASWAGASWDGASWDGASWDGASWDGASWDGASWDGASWDGASWDGASWDGASWDGAAWDSSAWEGHSWS
jgi:serine protease AprX